MRTVSNSTPPVSVAVATDEFSANAPHSSYASRRRMSRAQGATLSLMRGWMTLRAGTHRSEIKIVQNCGQDRR